MTTVITTDRDANGVLVFELAVAAEFYSLGEVSFLCKGTVDLLIKFDGGSGRKSRGRNRNHRHWRILVPASIDCATSTKITIDVVRLQQQYLSQGRVIMIQVQQVLRKKADDGG